MTAGNQQNEIHVIDIIHQEEIKILYVIRKI